MLTSRKVMNQWVSADESHQILNAYLINKPSVKTFKFNTVEPKEVTLQKIKTSLAKYTSVRRITIVLDLVEHFGFLVIDHIENVAVIGEPIANGNYQHSLESVKAIVRQVFPRINIIDMNERIQNDAYLCGRITPKICAYLSTTHLSLTEAVKPKNLSEFYQYSDLTKKRELYDQQGPLEHAGATLFSTVMKSVDDLFKDLQIENPVLARGLYYYLMDLNITDIVNLYRQADATLQNSFVTMLRRHHDLSLHAPKENEQAIIESFTNDAAPILRELISPLLSRKYITVAQPVLATNLPGWALELGKAPAPKPAPVAANRVPAAGLPAWALTLGQASAPKPAPAPVAKPVPATGLPAWVMLLPPPVTENSNQNYLNFLTRKQN